MRTHKSASHVKAAKRKGVPHEIEALSYPGPGSSMKYKKIDGLTSALVGVDFAFDKSSEP